MVSEDYPWCKGQLYLGIGHFKGKNLRDRSLKSTKTVKQWLESWMGIELGSESAEVWNMIFINSLIMHNKQFCSKLEKLSFISQKIKVYCTTDDDCKSEQICEMHYRNCDSFGKYNPDCLPGTCIFKQGIIQNWIQSVMHKIW